MKKVTFPAKLCLYCSSYFTRTTEQSTDFRDKKYCSRLCYGKDNRGENNCSWKGGFKTRPDGYIRDSRTDKYIHRIVMEKFLGRKLKTEENIHHKDGNPKNNNIDNLEILTNSEHRKL